MTELLVTFAFLLIIFAASIFLPLASVGKYVYRLSNFLEAKLANLNKQYLVLGDCTVCYFDNLKNDLPVLVLLLGFSADKNIWLRFAKHFKTTHRVIIPDLLGHGETPYYAHADYSSQSQMDMLIQFLARLGIKKMNVVGNSMGGMIAALLHQQHHALTDKVVMLNPAGAKTELAVYISANEINYFAHDSVSSCYDFFKMTMHKVPFMPRSVLKHIALNHYVKKNDQIKHQFKNFKKIESYFDIPFAKNCDNMLIIWGEKDQLIPVDAAQSWYVLSGQNPLIYKEVGHMPMFEAPARTARDVSKFMTE